VLPQQRLGRLEHLERLQLVPALLEALDQLYADPDLLAGFVALVAACGDEPRLRPLLHRLDMPAYLVHVYLNCASPLSVWADREAVLPAAAVPLPKLPPNTRASAAAHKKGNMGPSTVAASLTHYGGASAASAASAVPLHDFAPLLVALNSLLQPNTPAEGMWVLGTLSARALANEGLLERLVEKDPTAGVRPAALIRLVNKVTGAGGGAGGGAESATVPSAVALSTEEFEAEALNSAPPRHLLLVNIAALDVEGSLACGGGDDDDQSMGVALMVLEKLLDGIETGFKKHWLSGRRVDCLCKLLEVPNDLKGHHRDKAAAAETETPPSAPRLAAAAARSLEQRIRILQTGATPEVRALKPLAQCHRMEMLTGTLQRVRREHASELLGPASNEAGGAALARALAAGLEWVPLWLEQRRPQLRVTLKDLQGEWTNNQQQEIKVVGCQCSFASGEPVLIEQDVETGSFKVPGWSLLQDQSFPGKVVWASKQTRETTRWQRPQAHRIPNNPPGASSVTMAPAAALSRRHGGRGMPAATYPVLPSMQTAPSTTSSVPIVGATMMRNNPSAVINGVVVDDDDDDDDDDDLYNNSQDNLLVPTDSTLNSHTL